MTSSADNSSYVRTSFFLSCHYLLCCLSPLRSVQLFANPVDHSPPGSSVHGSSPGRILEWVAMPSSRGSSQPRDWTQVSRLAGGFFTIWASKEAQEYWSGWPIPAPGDLPDPGIEPGSVALQADSLPTELPGKNCLLLGCKKKVKFLSVFAVSLGHCLWFASHFGWILT